MLYADGTLSHQPIQPRTVDLSGNTLVITHTANPRGFSMGVLLTKQCFQIPGSAYCRWATVDGVQRPRKCAKVDVVIIQPGQQQSTTRMQHRFSRRGVK